MASWYYRTDDTDDTENGPISNEQLRTLARTGVLHPSTLVWKDGMPDWRPASSVKGLFDGGQRRNPPSDPSVPKQGAKPPAFPPPVGAVGRNTPPSAMQRATDSLKQTFGTAFSNTISQAVSAAHQVLRHPIRLSFITIVFLVASFLALATLVGAVLVPVFVMGYINCIKSTINDEEIGLEGFITFMRYGWDSFWHLLMLLAAFAVTFAAMMAPFVIAMLITYLVLGTAGATLGEFLSHSSRESRSVEREDFRRPMQPNNEDKPSRIGELLSDLASEIMGLGMKAVLLLIVVAALTPGASATILLFYLVFEVSVGETDDSNRFNLVIESFQKMLRIGRHHWKELVLSGLSVSVGAVAVAAMVFTISYLMLSAHLVVLAAWTLSALLPTAICLFVVYTNVFATMTCLTFAEPPNEE